MMSDPPLAGTLQRLSRRDAWLIAICLFLAAISTLIIARYFASAFPQASIDFRYDRASSARIATRFLDARGIDVKGMKHAVRFDSDSRARIFLERSLGLERANRTMAEDVRLWSWHHRWFVPLIEEEVSVDVAPTGEIVRFTHKISEDAPATKRPPPSGGARDHADADAGTSFLRSIGVAVDDLKLVDRSERRLPKRVQRIFTWESTSIHPAGAPYRYSVTIDDGVVMSYDQHLKVPDDWSRSYRELRSKNAAAGSIDLILMAATLVAAVVVFIIRLRRGDLPLRFLLGVGAAAVVLVTGVAANSLPSQLSYYDTTSSYPAFLGQITLQSLMQSLGMAMMLIVVCGAGEVLYRERLPNQLAIPRLWTPKALASKRVFLSLVLGYTLVPLFIAYQVVFYLGAQKFGAWAPAEVPYDEILSTAFPWIAVLFAGFFPALSEELLSRAFSIPLFQRLFRSRLAAIAVAGFIWGFGHATYPNQPFWIRGVEVGIVGIAAGLLMDRFGLLPLLVWHYTIDAVYTATLLFASGNRYYVVSASVASLLFVFPLLISVVGYVRRRGFLPDDDLTNATLPTTPPIAHEETATPTVAFPSTIPLTQRRVLLCVVLVVAAAVAVALRPTAPEDAIDYAITKEKAKEIADGHRAAIGAGSYSRAIATPVEGFRSWNPGSPREDGGSPTDFDSVAATYLVRHGMTIDRLVEVFRTRLEVGTWMVRFFTPMKKEELFIEVDPRSSRVIGYHKYQDERNRGPSLTRDEALTLARSAFKRYGLDGGAFDLREALTFKQPSRRDWLFHFEERMPLAGRGYRRVNVRVAGAEVTQFNKTVKVPESAYRDAQTQTLFNVVLFALQIVGVVALLALVIAGLVVASRSHRFRWKRALRWTAVLSVIPIAGFVAQYESMLFGYSTSVAWETFRISLLTAFVRDVGGKVGVLFLALAGLESAFPFAFSLPTIEGRRRFGRSAAVAAMTALSILTIAQVVVDAVMNAFPSAVSISIAAPNEVAIPVPALIAASQALFAAILFSGAVALYTQAVRKYAAPLTMAAVFCASIDPFITLREAPPMLLKALVTALLVWFVGKSILGNNPLAWPLVIFTGASLETAAVLFRNQRADLLANGIALVVLALVVLVWVCWRSEQEPQNLTFPETESR